MDGVYSHFKSQVVHKMSDHMRRKEKTVETGRGVGQERRREGGTKGGRQGIYRRQRRRKKK